MSPFECFSRQYTLRNAACALSKISLTQEISGVYLFGKNGGRGRIFASLGCDFPLLNTSMKHLPRPPSPRNASVGVLYCPPVSTL